MSRKVLVTGASGLLGRQVLRVFHAHGWDAVGTAVKRVNPPEIVKLDILDAKEIDRVLDEVKPNAVVHCAANRFPDSCASNPSQAQSLNVTASANLASAALSRGALFIYISTDYVFSGRPGEAPYSTNATPDPPNVYGQTKLGGERAVLDVARQKDAGNRVVVLRVPILYGSCDDPAESAVNVLLSQLWSAQNLGPSEQKIKVDDYAQRYPTNTADVGRVCKDLCQFYLDPANSARELPSILHFSSEDKMTKWGIVKVFSEIMGLPMDAMEPFKPEPETADGVVRPYDCHLDTSALRDLGIDLSTTNFTTWWRREVGAFRH